MALYPSIITMHGLSWESWDHQRMGQLTGLALYLYVGLKSEMHCITKEMGISQIR